MGLLGTLVGGGIGFMLGGPLGAILGGAIGSRVEVETGSYHGPSAGRASARVGSDYSRGQAQSAFIVALISLAAKVAKADGKVTPAEVRTFDEFLQRNLRMPAQDRRVAARIFNEARDSAVPAGAFARQIRGILGHQPDRMRDLVTLLLTIAWADGRLSPLENDLIRNIARDLGLDERVYADCKAQFESGNLDAAYAALGLDRNASDVEVKSAYRRLAKEYHPDVLAAKGMSEDFEQYAKDKIRTVNNAYAQIKEARAN